MNKQITISAVVASFVVGIILGASPVDAAQGSNEKVLICHKLGTPAEKELIVNSSAVAGHLKHGDSVGTCAPSSVEINCNDGIDGDGDGLTDCQDNDCHIHPECSEFGPPLD